MTVPYAALIGAALGVVKNRESEHERWRDGFEEAVFGTKGKVAAARDNARLELARQDALARVFGAHTNSLGMYEDQVARGMPAPQGKQGGSSLAGLGLGLAALTGGGDDKGSDPMADTDSALKSFDQGHGTSPLATTGDSRADDLALLADLPTGGSGSGGGSSAKPSDVEIPLIGSTRKPSDDSFLDEYLKDPWKRL